MQIYIYLIVEYSDQIQNYLVPFIYSYRLILLYLMNVA